MSKLQNLLNSMVQVIVRYHESQTLQSHSSSLLNMPWQELKKFLEKLIDEATQKQSTRLSMLHYTLWIIEQIKPVLDEEKPLLITVNNENNSKETQADYILKIMVTFFEKIIILLGTYDHQTISVEFGLKKEKIAGFLRNRIILSSYSKMGDIFNTELFEPFGFSKKTNSHEAFLKLINEHQLPLQEKEKCDTKEKQIQELQNKIIQLEKNEESLLEEIKKLQQQALIEKEKTNELILNNSLLQEKLNNTLMLLGDSYKKSEEQNNKTNIFQSKINHFNNKSYKNISSIHPLFFNQSSNNRNSDDPYISDIQPL